MTKCGHLDEDDPANDSKIHYPRGASCAGLTVHTRQAPNRATAYIGVLAAVAILAFVLSIRHRRRRYA
jgi:hypothetical protein